MTLLTRVLPHAPLLHLDAWETDDTATQLTLRVTSTQALVHRPLCRFPTRRVHRRSVPTVADLPWGPWRVVLRLQGRKCFCANGRCARRIFTERLALLVAPWARRTQRLAQGLVRIAVALAGTAGARLCRGLGLAVSRNTLLRRLRRQPLPEVATPHVLGVDDWAVRQGRTSGTIVSDRERRRALALLPDRAAKTVALGLPAHPGVGVIPRDRSSAYADGARQGAPDAIQVADRLHLLQNLAEALDQVFHAHGNALEAVHETLRQAPVPPPAPPRKAQELAHPRQARRLALHQQIGAFHPQGWPGGAIAQPLGIGKNTVGRSLQTETLPARKRRTDRGRSRLTPYTPDLLERWHAGCRDALRRFRERQQRGNPGSDATVAREAPRLRHAQGVTSRQRRPRHPVPVVTAPPPRALTPRRATWLVLRRPETQDDHAAA